MADMGQVVQRLRGLVFSQIQARLWRYKVELGNRRIRALGRHLDAKIEAANKRDFESLTLLATRSEWEHFRDERIATLRHDHDLDSRPAVKLAPSITRTLQGDGFHIDNLVFNSRPGVAVTANCYRPSTAGQTTSPGVVICHGHHYPKTEDELQCLGITLARSGCFVLIMDMLGHGERRQHPFASIADYPGSFEVDSQDYYSRNTLGAQLDLLGASLPGWMSWDLMRGIDLLLTEPGVNPEQIVLIGGVADGGDLAAVAGALDPRVAGVVAFNFGETPVGDWNPTGCIAHTAHNGFWPWLILAAIAPRKLVYGREFAWESQHDPVWQRLVSIYELYKARDSLRSIHGSGSVTGHGPEDSHCNNIGFLHRQQLYSILHEWFGVRIPDAECAARYSWHELASLEGSKKEVYRARPLHELAREISQIRLAKARTERVAGDPAGHVTRLKQDLANILGPMVSVATPVIRSRPSCFGKQEHIDLEVENGVWSHLHIFWPTRLRATPGPIVIGLAQEGNPCLKHCRRDLISRLRHGGAAVCLAELRGVGDGRHGELYRGRISPSTEVASASLALGESLMVSRQRDLRSIIAYLGAREEINHERIALWGDSLATTNSGGVVLAVPFDADERPRLGEPLGGVAALLGGLFEPHIRAIYIHGGLTGYASLLDAPFFCHPPDSIISGLLSVADLCDILAALAPRPVLMEALVDGCNRRATRAEVENVFCLARRAYEIAGVPQLLRIDLEANTADQTAAWLLAALYQ